MAYTELSRIHVEGKVLDVELNIDIKKAQGNDTYKGSVITMKGKDGKSEDIKVAQKFLDNSYQADLKAQFAAVKSGDLITVVKVKTTKLTKEEYDALDKESQKTNANWGVAEVLMGHVAPERKSTGGTSGGKSGGFRGGAKDMTGVFVGHALNGAFNYLGGDAKADEYAETAKKIHDITTKVKADYAALQPSLSEYDVGAASGNAVLNALSIAKAKGVGLDQVEKYAKHLLVKVVPSILEYIKGAPAQAEDDGFDAPAPEVEKKAAEPKPTPKKTTKAAPAPAPEPEPDEGGVDDDDTLPF